MEKSQQEMPVAGKDYIMRKIENLIHATQLTIVVLLWLLGSVTEVIIPVVATLVGLLMLSVGALIFFSEAKKRYIASRTIDKMMVAAKKKTDVA